MSNGPLNNHYPHTNTVNINVHDMNTIYVTVLYMIFVISSGLPEK